MRDISRLDKIIDKYYKNDTFDRNEFDSDRLKSNKTMILFNFKKIDILEENLFNKFPTKLILDGIKKYFFSILTNKN